MSPSTVAPPGLVRPLKPDLDLLVRTHRRLQPLADVEALATGGLPDTSAATAPAQVADWLVAFLGRRAAELRASKTGREEVVTAAFSPFATADQVRTALATRRIAPVDRPLALHGDASFEEVVNSAWSGLASPFGPFGPQVIGICGVCSIPAFTLLNLLPAKAAESFAASHESTINALAGYLGQIASPLAAAVPAPSPAVLDELRRILDEKRTALRGAVALVEAVRTDTRRVPDYAPEETDDGGRHPAQALRPGTAFHDDPGWIENVVEGVLLNRLIGTFSVILKPPFSTPPDGVPISPGDLFLRDDPIAKELFEDRRRVFSSRRELELEKTKWVPIGLPFLAYYRGGADAIWPNIISETTAPALVEACRRQDEQFRADMNTAAETMEDILWWYVGLRFAPRVRTGRTAAEAVRSGRGAAAGAAEKATKIADSLVDATQGLPAARDKFIAGIKLIAKMRHLSAAEKVDVVLVFMNRIGFAIRTNIDEGAYYLMESEDGYYALKFMKQTGDVVYGKLEIIGLEATWRWIPL